jgi:sterol desaturase/sphingolipid hydroxylase (fatty acid hydroxylase superfamily)
MALIDHEPLIRVASFSAVLLFMLFVQTLWPRRGDGRPARRQAVNFALAVLNTLILRLAFPILAVGLAVIVHDRQGGLFGWLAWPAWLAIPIAMLMLEFVIYWQHRLMHAIPLLWRLHRIHHIDTGFDVTTGFRFHPFEIALSMAIKLGVIWLLGPHPVAVLVFEVLLAIGALWTHTDIALPKPLDRTLRWLFVTPSMHRIHHSSWRPETDSNYGFHLSIWDRLFGSYTASPRSDDRTMTIGLSEFRSERDLGLLSLLRNPFRSPDKDA